MQICAYVCMHTQVLLYKESDIDTTFVAEYIDVPVGNTFHSGVYTPGKFYLFQVHAYIYTVCTYIRICIRHGAKYI